MSQQHFAPVDRHADTGLSTIDGDRVQVYLTRKLADMLNGVDLRQCGVGDVIELSRREALILLSEGWATPVSTNEIGRR